MAFAQLSAREAEKFIKEQKLIVLDVRTPEEFSEGHIEGAINQDILDSSFPQKISQLKKQETYLVYCRSGARSDAAARIMYQLGFVSIVVIPGGISEWRDENLSLVR